MGVGLPATVDPPAQGGASVEPRSEVTQARPEAAAATRSAPETRRLQEVLRVHYARVWRTLRRLGVHEAAVDDAAQEVFIVFSRRLHEVAQSNERTFLLGSALRIAANYRRSSRARHEVADEQALSRERDPQPTVEQLLEQKQLRQTLDDMLDGWPEEIRTAFVLFELEGLTAVEIAEMTETKLGTVASRLRRGRELFQAGVRRLRARGAAGDVR